MWGADVSSHHPCPFSLPLLPPLLFLSTSLPMLLHRETAEKQAWSKLNWQKGKRCIFNQISSPVTHVCSRRRKEAIYLGMGRLGEAVFI